MDEKEKYVSEAIKVIAPATKLEEIAKEIPNISDIRTQSESKLYETIIKYDFSSLYKDKNGKQIPSAIISYNSDEGEKKPKITLPRKFKNPTLDLANQELSFQTDNFHYRIRI